MDIGVKELYYKEAAPSRSFVVSAEQTPTNAGESGLSERERQQRERKKQLLALSQEDNRKTALKRRANTIFNGLLREIDHELHRHVQELEVQPELVCLRWLRCLLAREFALDSLLAVWDFVFSGQPDAALHNLDCVCLALLELQRERLMQSDYIACLKFASKPLRLACHRDVLGVAQRVRKILAEKRAAALVIEESKFPSMLERDVERFRAQSRTR